MNLQEIEVDYDLAGELRNQVDCIQLCTRKVQIQAYMACSLLPYLVKGLIWFATLVIQLRYGEEMCDIERIGYRIL